MNHWNVNFIFIFWAFRLVTFFAHQIFMSYNECWTVARLSKCYRIIDVVLFSNSLKIKERKKNKNKTTLKIHRFRFYDGVYDKLCWNAWVWSVVRFLVGLCIDCCYVLFMFFFFVFLIDWTEKRKKTRILNSNTIAECWSFDRISNQFLSENFKPEILKWSLWSHILFIFNRNCLSIPLS